MTFDLYCALLQVPHPKRQRLVKIRRPLGRQLAQPLGEAFTIEFKFYVLFKPHFAPLSSMLVLPIIERDLKKKFAPTDVLPTCRRSAADLITRAERLDRRSNCQSPRLRVRSPIG